MTGKKVGYIRVSTFEQNPDRQLVDIELDKKFIDYASAKSMERPELKAMLDYVREDDIVVVHSMDRLARNLRMLLNIVQGLVVRGIQVKFVKENLIFNGSDNPMSTLMLSLMGAFAEFEYNFIRERQREGIEQAKKKGKYRVGQPTKLNNEMKEKIIEAMKTRDSKSDIAKNLGISRTALYKYLRKMQLPHSSA